MSVFHPYSTSWGTDPRSEITSLLPASMVGGSQILSPCFHLSYLLGDAPSLPLAIGQLLFLIFSFVKSCSLKRGMDKIGMEHWGMETVSLSSSVQLYFRSSENKDNAFVLGKQ